MVKRVSFKDAPCPVARSLGIVGDGWSLLIVRDALNGVRRFSALQSNLGIGSGMLASRLRDLMHQGILKTALAGDGRACLEYELTPKGRDLILVISALHQWGEDHLSLPGASPSKEAAAGLDSTPAPTRRRAVSIRKSLASPLHIISMIDGKPYKTLRRHLTRHGMTPDEYRQLYGLKGDYPMVAPAHSERRRKAAKQTSPTSERGRTALEKANAKLRDNFDSSGESQSQ